MRVLILAMMVCLSTSACATSKKRMRAPSEDFSYRVKGTEETGKISRGTQNDLFQSTKSWAWPLKSLGVTSSFGNRHGEFHDGLDLKAESGTPVFSVAEGKVIYAGNRISGYGNMIVIKHEKELSTVYAHTKEILIKKGAEVKRGQLIAYSGNTGRSSGPHLHFEVRLGVKAINPLYVLPKRGGEQLPTRLLASTPARASMAMHPLPATQSPRNARVVSSNSRISQSAAVRPGRVYRRVREYSSRAIPQKDLRRRRLVRNPSSTESE